MNLKIKVLPPYVNSPATRWHFTGNPTASYSVKLLGQTLVRGCWAVGSCSPEQWFQLSGANTAQTIGKLIAQYQGELWPKSPKYLQDFI